MNLVSKAGYSLEEQMEIAGTDTTPVSPKVERVDGVLNQGQAGYYLEEQMEISAGNATPVSPKIDPDDGVNPGLRLGVGHHRGVHHAEPL